MQQQNKVLSGNRKDSNVESSIECAQHRKSYNVE